MRCRARTGVSGLGLRNLGAWASAAGALLASPAPGQVLGSAIDRVLLDAKIGDAAVGVSVVDVDTGAILAGRRADEPLVPASNMKLLTTGAALDVLGTDFVFRTEIRIAGDRVVVVGAGDPALGDPALLDRTEPRLTPGALVQRLARAVADAGVTRVSEVIVDDRVFDREFVHPGWPADQLMKSYCAQVSGLNFHSNVLSVFPSPSAAGPGRPPTIAIEPEAPWLEIENKARTASGGGSSAWVMRDQTGALFTLHGEVSARVAIDITLHDPAAFTGRLIASALLDAGVRVGVGTPGTPSAPTTAHARSLALAAVRPAGPGERFDGARTAAVVTTELPEVLRRCNTESENLYAECLLKRVGREVTGQPGSWANGSSVLRMRLSERLGPGPAASTVCADGSGLTRENRVSPRTLTRWLESLAQGPGAEVFLSSLAAPGDGTLRRRFKSEPLRNEVLAKSGAIDGVRCLSGYVTNPRTGRRVAFSVMLNDLKPAYTQAGLRLHEDIVGEIDAYLTNAPQVRTEPKSGG